MKIRPQFIIILCACLFMFTSSVFSSTSDVVPNINDAKSKFVIINQVSVHGFVVDEFGEPMVGVKVFALGSENQTITNTEGKYSVVANINDIIEFEQIGAITKKEKVTSSHILNVSLSLEE